ncbi:hypothetical protein AC249_AIPGENE11994 [Exaiptasia diaphana]|nr:hypothetical protein AC249_AIPGENE11994 [Exaiptasia diaphana]
MVNIVKYRRIWLWILFQLWAPSRSVYTSSPSPTEDWISTSVPLYYVIALAVLVVLVLVSCVICIICTRRRVNQGNELALNNGVEQGLKENLEAESGNESITHPTIHEEVPLSISQTDRKSIPKESNGKYEDGQVCNSTEDFESNEASNIINKTVNETKEPLYAEVKKDNKGKQSKSTAVVYAELVVMENSQDAKGTRETTNYAEITRLAQSPRDMAPFED